MESNLIFFIISISIFLIEAIIHYNIGKKSNNKQLKMLLNKCKIESNEIEELKNLNFMDNILSYIPDNLELIFLLITIILSYVLVQYIKKYISK